MRVLVLLTLLAGCFNIDEPPCAYSCGSNGECPDDYSCGSDNYCHLHGTGLCSYSDLALAPDLTVPENMTDSGVPDLAATD